MTEVYLLFFLIFSLALLKPINFCRRNNR